VFTDAGSEILDHKTFSRRIQNGTGKHKALTLCLMRQAEANELKECSILFVTSKISLKPIKKL